MLEEGIFDIHCHIVPGVDDGAADIEETRLSKSADKASLPVHWRMLSCLPMTG